tara:strand:+ start:230 stop:715 length:486 start_codon:yes stop_codon:yes gene_type:complete
MKITFGKYRNQDLSIIYNDENYKNWLLNQSFFKDKYPQEYEYLKNYPLLCGGRSLSQRQGDTYKKPINFNDLPSDIKSGIFKINYDLDKKEKKEKQKNDNIKKREDFLNRRNKYYKGFRCECGKKKKPEYWSCYSCFSEHRWGGKSPIYMKWNYDMCGCHI